MNYLKLIWGIAIFFLVYGGIYYSFILKFPQLRLKSIIKGLKGKTYDGISVLEGLSISLAARIGVGSLAGVSLAIYYGGPGSIFWIWVICIINSVNTFVECYLGLKYQRIKEGVVEGGPSFYILNGLKNKFLSIVYAVIVIITYIIGFISIQSNTIVVSLNNYFNLSPVTTGLLLMFLVSLTISGGLKQITSVTEKLVRIISAVYIFVITYVICKNFTELSSVFLLIFKSAFNPTSAVGGFLGTFLIGIQRGVFSTESGLGTSSIASSCSVSKNKLSICFSQIFGIYFTVFLICTSTAIMILTSDYTTQAFNNINGIELTQYAFSYHMGVVGVIILILSVLFFAFSTIIAGYYYGESNLNFLFNNKKLFPLLKLLTMFVVFIGSIITPKILWNVVDFLVAILAIINMYSILRLKREVKQDYQSLRNLV